MIVFYTKFYVKKELTKEKFIELAFKWVNDSPHYNFNNICWNKEELYEQECEKQKFSMVLSNDTKIIAIRLENTDNDNVIWTNDFVYEECNENNLFIVRLARDAVNKESNVTKGYHRPWLMKTILKLGYGSEDNGLPISNQVIVVDENNIQLAESIICGKSKYILPIVYVTKCFYDNETILDVNELAKDLAGSAHVIVEKDTKITSELKEKTSGMNPFNGAVHIFYTNKVGTRIVPDEFSDSNSFRFKIVNAVCHRLSLVKIDDKYTWGTIKYQKLLEKYHQDKQSSLEFARECEEILKLKEKEYAQLIEEMELELNELRNKVQNYEYSFNSKRKVKTGDIIFDCNEEEFFEGEIKDMILRLLDIEMKKMDMDPNQRGWRKYHVLHAIVDNNKTIGKGEELASELKSIFKRIDRLSTKDRKRLIELGFVSRENKHNKLYFHNDDRYLITLGKTPSDSHAAQNSASTAVNTIICR